MAMAQTTKVLPRRKPGTVDQPEAITSTGFVSSDHDNTIRKEPWKNLPDYRNYGHRNEYRPNSGTVPGDLQDPPPYVASYDSTTSETWCHELETQDTVGHLSVLMNSPTLDDKQKFAILTSFPPSVLDEAYERHIAAHGPLQIPGSTRYPRTFEGPSEETYLPLVEHAVQSPDPTAPPPIYPKYAGHFRTSEQARRYRKRARLPPKGQAPDVERVQRYGRQYWVRRIYEAMIDISYVSDSDTSIHRQRFVVSAAFEPTDLEATAHHIFDSALAVHERGWSRPNVYYKKVVRGKLIDVSEKSLESRLARICYCLRQKKATVDDAIRGGVTLALLCDNPEARAFTKASNNTGNKKRGERLRQAKSRDGEDEQEEQDQSD